MKAATDSKRKFGKTPIGICHETLNKKNWELLSFKDMIDFLNPGDVWVINQTSTLPARFPVYLKRENISLELRLASFSGSSLMDMNTWNAVLFTNDHWKLDTSKRTNIPSIKKGDILEIGNDFHAMITKVHAHFPRMLQIDLQSSTPLYYMYKYGKPIQYSYMNEEISILDHQTIFSGPPVSVEPPSASLQMNWALFFALKAKGIHVLPVIHGAGISTTGDSELDQKLPLAEFSKVPTKTAQSINKAKKENKRIIAQGTTVMRSLESFFDSKEQSMKPGETYTNLKLNADHLSKVTDGLITGIHEEGSSHRELLTSLINAECIEFCYQKAHKNDLKIHEFGDLMLVLAHGSFDEKHI